MKFFVDVIGKAEVEAETLKEAKRLVYAKLVKDGTLFQFALETEDE